MIRKVSKKRYLCKNIYEPERFLLPIPFESRALVKLLHSRDLEISMNTDEESLVVRFKPICMNIK